MASMIRQLRRLVFSRVMIVGLLILFQLAVLLDMVLRFSRHTGLFYSLLLLLSAAVTLWVVSREDNPTYKLAWVIPILLFPVFGGVLYLLLNGNLLSRVRWIRMRAAGERTRPAMQPPPDAAAAVAALPAQLQSQSARMLASGYPAWPGTETVYHASGESKFEAMLCALEEAKNYILLEYFIISEGVMWERIHDILRRKAAEGVEVRMIYDGFGSLMTLPDGYWRTLRAEGIDCLEFNPLIPVLSLIMQNRDHRKILVVDGRVGFMGGINIGDEYINAKVRFGHWKDAAVELRGPAVWSLVVMFACMWNGICGKDLDLERYRPAPAPALPSARGVVQPYADSPLDRDLVGQMVYLNMLGRATRYVYICTPYLIIDNETITSLLLAASSGVDVRIITPHMGDKRFVHITTRSYYERLVRGGVKIYEYKPGFLHSKTFVADDEVAAVGTINLDYRSFYLHFECGVWMAQTPAVAAMRDDFLKTLEQCIEITHDSPLINVGIFQRLARIVLGLFAPLM